jgi:hypothetical protein
MSGAEGPMGGTRFCRRPNPIFPFRDAKSGGYARPARRGERDFSDLTRGAALMPRSTTHLAA